MRLPRLLVAVVACVVCVGCATVPITGRRQLSIVSTPELVALSQDGYQQLLSDAQLSTDTKMNSRVEKVGRKIASAAETFLREHGQAADIAHYQWEFKLINDDKTVNALCLPDGKVVVYSGILPYAKDETGLAVIMGHEVAHAIANHGGERMSQLLLLEFGGQKLAEALAQKPQKTRNLLLTAYGVGAQLGVALPYSRLHETEADRIGLIIMHRAGYDPRAAIPFWKRMSTAGDKVPGFLSTHPATARRIENLERMLPEVLRDTAK